MRKRFAAYLLSLICVFSLFGSAAFGREKDARPARPNGVVQDWSWHHLVFPSSGPMKAMISLQHDQRAIASWQAAVRKERGRWHFGELRRARTAEHRDWSIPLGGGSTPYSMYPAKFDFDPSATPDCTKDYIVYPINVAGSLTQPNLVAFNNLYSGTGGAITGICNAGQPGITRTVSAGVDDGVSATTLWAYNVNAIGGSVPTSPALSLDGTKVAFVETAPGVPAHFHVLAPNSGDGVATNLQAPATAPLAITVFTSGSPVADSGTATDLQLGSTAADTNTLSSPFVDLANDLAYIGNDNGTLFRVKDVFCPSWNNDCTGGTPPAPSLDTNWGGTGAVSVCSGTLTGAVTDNLTGNIFVGCSDGNLYGFTPAGVALANPSVAVGDGTATGGIVDAPMIDAVNGFVYVTSGSSSGGTAVLVQASTADLGSVVTATLGAGGHFNMHSPDFNDAYFSNPGTPSSWLLYIVGLNSGDTSDTLFGVGFTSGHIMNSGPPTNSISAGAPAEFSPVTEFLNGGTDQIFFSALVNANPNFLEFHINTFPASFSPSGANQQGNGTSAIVVDNSATDGQASSVYFAIPSTNMAVKLTQAGLN